MKYIPIIILFLSIASCFYASGNVTDEVSVLSVKLSLIDQNGQCILQHESSQMILEPKPPCFFLRNSDKKPQYYSYEDINTDAVLIVAGTPVSMEIRKDWGLSEDAICGMDSQGVLIKAGEVSIAKNTLKGGVLCKDNGSDEKNFWYFAHKK